MIFKKNFLLFMTLIIFFSPIIVNSALVTSNGKLSGPKRNLDPPFQEASDFTQSSIEEESKLFLESVNKRLSSGEDDPDTPTRVFVHWDTRLPDFPEWVDIDYVFDLIPVVQVTCALKDVPRLSEEVKYVTYVVSVDEGILPSISGFNQAYDPYVGEYPLLLNETRSLVNAEDTNTAGSEVVIAILSTGINDAHPMLDDMDDDELTLNDPKIVVSYDAHYKDTRVGSDETNDNNGRGTALASIVAGTATVGGKLEASIDFTYPFPYGTDRDYNTQELDAWINVGTQMGLAPEAYLFDVKITDNGGNNFDEGAVIHGIEWSVEHGADIILLDDISDITAGSTVMRAIEAATSHGSLVIVPAGDFEEFEGYDDDFIAPYYTIRNPASEITALTVGATTETNALWVRSERGPVSGFELSKPDVVAPGVHMIGANTDFADNEVTNPGGWEGEEVQETLYYDVFSGTAIAAAVAAGTSARLIEAYPGASPTAIKIALRQGATDLGFNEMAQGKGKVNLGDAMDILLNAPKQANNWVGHRHYNYSDPFTATYQDFEGVKILFDGSWTDSSLGSSVDHEWGDLTNGNLTELGVSSNWQYPYDDSPIAAPVSLATLGGSWQHPYDDSPVGNPVDLETLGPSDWQHPYNDTVAGYYWYNVSYPLAERLTLRMVDLNIRTGDNFTVYQSDIPNDPDPTGTTLIATTTTNISSVTDYQTLADYNNLYFAFGSDGDGAATDYIFGMYGSIFQHGSSWYNISYQLAERLTVRIDNLTLEDGDRLNVYQSAIPNDLNPLSLISTPNNISSATDYITDPGRVNLYFEFVSDGDNAAIDTIFGMTGSIFQHGSTWWNVTFPGAEVVTVELDSLTIADGDSLTIYYSNIPDDPNPTDILIGLAVNVTSTLSWSTPTDQNCLYFKFTGNGDGVTATSPDIWGMVGSISLAFYADDAEPGDISNFEFTELVSELEDLGATVEYWYAEDEEAPPTATLLEYYDAYVLAQPLARFYSGTYNLPKETSYYEWLSGNLTAYLDNGGRVLFIGDAEHPYYNYATNALGVTWNQGGGGGPTNDFINHALLTTPFVIEELLIDAPYTYFTGSSNTLVRESGVQTITYYDQTNGRAVFVADEDVFNDELWDEPFSLTPDRYNNSQFALNIFYWFTGITYQSGAQSPYDNHFKVVSYSCPPMMTDGDPWDLEVTVQNIGNYTNQAWVAFGMDHNPDPWVILGDSAYGNPATGIFVLPSHDNANDTWQLPADGDIGTDVTNSTIEFYYNISTDYPIDQIAFPYILLEATGMDRQTEECYLSINGIQLSPIYETNTTSAGPYPTGSGMSFYPINPATLNQYNNTVEITVPENITLRLDTFLIMGYNFTNSLGNIGHVVTPALAPNEEYTVSYQYTPSGLSSPINYTPRVQIYPYNATYAYISPGYVSPGVVYTNIKIDHGIHIPLYYNEPDLDVFALKKIVRRGDLPLLYDVSPGSLDSSSSVKIVRFPGDIRVDGLTVMSSTIIDQPNLRISGGIASLIGLGNITESLDGLGSYSSYAPDYFYINDTWTATNRLNLEYLNHSSSGSILQTDIPPTQTPGTITGTLSLYSNDTALYSINLQLDIVSPSGSFLLYDTDTVDTIDLDRDYDKLWDQVFEMWSLASNSGYDIDSLYQEWYLFEHRSHIDLANDDVEYFADYVCNVPAEEDLPYSGILAVSMDSSEFDPADEFLARGGSLIQFGSDFHLGPTFSPNDISYIDDEITTLVDTSGSTNPLLNGIDQLFGFGGDYMLVAQDSYDLQQNYDAISGQNWLYTATVDKPNNDFAVIYHDAIYPQRFGHDAGKYSISAGDFDQTYKGMKIIIASENLGHSWFLEQPDYWAYASMQYAASQNVIDDIFDVNLGNREFIENVFKTAANKAPEIVSVSISPEHVSIGDNITVGVKVSDESISSLTVAIPDKLTASDLKYVEMVYDSSSNAYIGTFPVISTNLINNWNIYIFDDLYHLTLANDAYSQFIPRINVLPTAWTTDQMDTYPYTHLTTVEKGEMITLTVYYMDEEDNYAILCNVSLVHYKNRNESEIVYFKLFSGGQGRGLFFIDTTDLSSGTHLAVATVTDTDGGTASYELAGFNIGKGTLYKEPPRGGVDLAPIVGGAAVVTVVAGAAGGTLFLYLRRTGKSLRELFGRE